MDDGSESVQLLPFLLTGDLYCVEIERIETVLPVDGSAPLERAANPMEAGTVTVDGSEVRVVDLARVLNPGGAIDRPDQPELMIFKAVGSTVGWLVEQVGEARRVSTDRIEPSPPGSKFVRGRIDTGSRTLTWLDEEGIND